MMKLYFRGILMGVLLITHAQANDDRVALLPSPEKSSPAQARGPDDLPDGLAGVWKVSLCVTSVHAWIRFESLVTGEVHTLGRYAKGYGRLQRYVEGEPELPPVAVSGVHWDRDLTYEDDLRHHQVLHISVIVRNPRVFRGQGDGYGFRAFRNNCTTYARNAWHHYSGEWYRLPGIALPTVLETQVWHRHPVVRKKTR